MKSVEIEELEDNNNPDTGYNSCDDKAETDVSQLRHQSRYPIKNLVEMTNSQQDITADRGPSSRSSSRPREVPEGPTVTEGWHGPVLQRTRAVPVRCYGRIQVSTSQPAQVRSDQFFNRDGWTEIPIQRI